MGERYQQYNEHGRCGKSPSPVILPPNCRGSDGEGWIRLFSYFQGPSVLSAHPGEASITYEVVLLKRLSLEAPGTYHHSLAVANLSEAAAESVGANPTICRVGSYFHDIGKLVKPQYFTENIPHGANPHDDLTPTMSALIIIAHVKEGIDLALKNNLNPEIVDIIRQHHGTSTVSYFLQRALRTHHPNIL